MLTSLFNGFYSVFTLSSTMESQKVKLITLLALWPKMCIMFGQSILTFDPCPPIPHQFMDVCFFARCYIIPSRS